ncbi:MAG TPA: ABC transporter substrate-binding protein, partial [Candidatus Saccharimonadales bacterium]|nr:ABC transporter substrate-binding protein [Candidatus Saccharimonadales bacterium]
MKHHAFRLPARLIFGIALWACLFLQPHAGAQQASIKPEKNQLQVGTAGSGTTSLPLFVAFEGGYFAKRGLNVSISQVGATIAVQGVISGTIDIYQGGTAAIAANLAGADLIYVAAAVDRNSLILFGQKGITSLEGLRGKAIATTFPGAFGEIAIRMTARKLGMEVGKDFKLLYHRSPPEALSTFLMGNSDGLVITPPQTELAKQQGYPIIIDYYKEGLKIVGPGTSVMREYAQKYPNTIKAYLMSYLDGLKRAIDDEEFARKIESKYTKISDPKILAENYQQGLRVWNRDMTVDPVAIRVVLDDSSDAKAKNADPKRFYDNSLIQ